jgi:Uma2 family endonuclease
MVPESPPRSNRGDWTWELVTQFPRQGEWTESEYLSRSFEGLVEFSHGVLEFVDPLCPQDEGGPPSSKRGDWTWEMVTQFPRQGEWTEESYFALPDTRFIELKDGCLEFLPMPSWKHQYLARFLFRRLDAFVESRRLGEVMFTGLNVRLERDHVRVPDVVFVAAARLGDPRQVQELADLMIEVVSPSHKDRHRDLVEKRLDYAAAGIPEYWIVDPETETITVLMLPAGASEYAVHGEFRPGDTASSKLLDGFTVDVAACFSAAKGASDEPPQGQESVKE